MNRIILIGNGFDLSHALKTSYKDFIDDFWEQKLKSFSFACRNRGSGVIGENIIRTSSGIKYKDNDITVDINNIYIRSIIPNIDILQNKTGFNKFLSFISFFKNTNNSNDIIFNNIFLERITINQQLQNWVDIEDEYYKALLKCLKGKTEDIDKLNDDFQNIQNALENYLSKEIERTIVKNLYADSIFYSSLSQDDFIHTLEPTEKIENIMFLNFNYTPTLKIYKNSDIPNRVIHIHGELNNLDNPIIFGYGDEIDKNYSTIEDANNKSYYKKIKSFMYSLKNNYKDMLKFINSCDYQIFIIGHSCGVSDRTLLNTLFEHQNCKSIKIYYYTGNNDYDSYNDTYMNLSRNFKDKQRMREIVVSKESTFPYC